MRGAEAAIWLARLEAEQDNLRAALQWALDKARYEDAAWLMVAVHYFWYLGGHRYEGARWLAQLLPQRTTLANDLRLAILICFFASAHELDESLTVDAYMGELMQLLEDGPHKLLQSTAWYFLAWSASDVSQAIVAVERSIALVRMASELPALGAEFGAMADRDFVLASMLQWYATNLIEQGEFTQAATHSMESLKLFRTQGNRYGIADCLGNLGRLALLQGDLAQAHALLHEVMALATSFQLPRDTVQVAAAHGDCYPL